MVLGFVGLLQPLDGDYSVDDQIQDAGQFAKASVYPVTANHVVSAWCSPIHYIG